MSGAAQAREKRTKTRGDFYCERPADEPANSPLPKYGWIVQHAMIPSDGVIYQAMKALKPAELPEDRGWLLRNAGITAIARATAPFTHDGRPMPRRTVAHRLQAMTRKRILIRWEADSRARNHSAGTSWRIPRYDEVLDRWAADPEIATVGPKRAFYVQGKGRDLMAPARAIAWHIDHVKAEANPAAHASPIAIAEVTQREAPPKPETPPLDLAPLFAALLETCGAADDRDAAFVWSRVVHVSGKREHCPTPEDAGEMVRSIYREFRKMGGSHSPFKPGLVEKRIGARVEAWHRNRVKDASAKATQERWARDNRIDNIAEWIRILARDDVPPDDRARYAELLSTADPAERNAAEEALEQSRARTA
jgi:hypothetical protein